MGSRSAGEGAPPNGVPRDWKQIPHGKDGNAGPSGETRWVNPEGTKGLEHHPAKDSGGGHQEEEHLHPLKPKSDGKGWTFTNPKQTLIGSEAAKQAAANVGVGVVALGAVVGIWEGVKWGVAILGVPETGGMSLALLAAP